MDSANEPTPLTSAFTPPELAEAEARLAAEEQALMAMSAEEWEQWVRASGDPLAWDA